MDRMTGTATMSVICYEQTGVRGNATAGSNLAALKYLMLCRTTAEWEKARRAFSIFVIITIISLANIHMRMHVYVRELGVGYKIRACV